MEQVDVLVAGAGLAGLRTASLLAQQGFDVLVCERRARLDSGIRTTGIFAGARWRISHCRNGISGRRYGVLLYPPSLRAPVELVSTRDEYRVADMPPARGS